jgi:hypothetical protein
MINVADYGAVGTSNPGSPVDDTVAIRVAIAAAMAASSPTSGFIDIWFPESLYCLQPQPSDPISGPLLNLVRPNALTQNIRFIGSTGYTELRGFMPGFKLPAAAWYTKTPTAGTGGIPVPPGQVISNGSNIGRFQMFGLTAAKYPIANIEFINLYLNGQVPYSGNAPVYGDPATGLGWDTSHKAILISGNVDGIKVINCKVANWAGEELFSGGSLPGAITSIGTDYSQCNASAISCSAGLSVMGGSVGAGSSLNVYNGFECYATTPEQFVDIDSVSIGNAGNGVVVSGNAGSSISITNCSIGGNVRGILLSNGMDDCFIAGNTFSGNTAQDIINTETGAGIGFSNITIEGNSSTSPSGLLVLQKPIANLTVSGNKLTGIGTAYPALVSGVVNVQANNVFSDNALTHAKDVSGPSLSTTGGIGLWSGTTRDNAAPGFEYGAVYNDFVAGSTSGSFVPYTDFLELNACPAPKGVPYILGMTPEVLALCLEGMAVTFVTTGKQWVLGAGSWNNFTVNVPVTNGLKIQLVDGVFEVVG